MERNRYVKFITTDRELAKKVQDAFHALTSFSSMTQKKQQLFLVSTNATEKAGVVVLERIIDSIVREDDIFIVSTI